MFARKRRPGLTGTRGWRMSLFPNKMDGRENEGGIIKL